MDKVLSGIRSADFPHSLEVLLSTPSVSGDELSLSRKMCELYLEAGADRVEIDLVGNVLAWKGEPSRAVCAHLDTIGYMVSEVLEEHCKLIAVGGTQPAFTQRALLHTQTGDILGLLLSEPTGKNPVFEPLDAEAIQSVQVGDRLSYFPTYDRAGKYLQGPYLDNRLGCYMSIEALRSSENILAVATVCEETTGMGAKQALQSMEGIDAALVLDVTYAKAYGEENPVRLGKGPVVCMMDSLMPVKLAVDEVLEAAESVGVTLQREVTDVGGSDMEAFLNAPRPMWAVFFGIASRYNHRPFEVVNWDDLEAALKVSQAWCNLPPPSTSTKSPVCRKKL